MFYPLYLAFLKWDFLQDWPNLETKIHLFLCLPLLVKCRVSFSLNLDKNSRKGTVDGLLWWRLGKKNKKERFEFWGVWIENDEDDPTGGGGGMSLTLLLSFSYLLLLGLLVLFLFIILKILRMECSSSNPTTTPTIMKIKMD